MSILVRDSRELYRHEIEKELGKDCSGKDVLDYMFGTYENDYRGSSDLVLRKWSNGSGSPLQRINMFWALPLTALLSPVMYIKNGKTGWDTKTRVGRFVLRVTGLLEE